MEYFVPSREFCGGRSLENIRSKDSFNVESLGNKYGNMQCDSPKQEHTA